MRRMIEEAFRLIQLALKGFATRKKSLVPGSYSIRTSFSVFRIPTMGVDTIGHFQPLLPDEGQWQKSRRVWGL